MLQHQEKSKINLHAIAFGICLIAPVLGLAAGAPPVNDPPLRCTGYGNLQSISLTDWEAGLGSWTVGTHDVADADTFDTADWGVVSNLPDGQTGMAAFVANLNEGDCGEDDESGALTLNSPTIVLPAGSQIPRISFDHWFDIEEGWDGGNLKISVNGGPFTQLPAAAIEVGTYTGTLLPPIDNSNPLAGQDAYTGTFDNQLFGSWIQSHINLLGIATGGDSIRLQFDFGIDGCGGIEGWYVDDVEFYRCEAELPPSDCGNEVIDQGEQCDDGNDFIGDGCSNICQIEPGWQCTAPTPPGSVSDPSFEAGRPNPAWDESSNNPFGSPICNIASCNTGGGTGPADGDFWAWFGGVPNQEGSLSQTVVIPSSNKELAFQLEIPVCASPGDYLEVLIDDNQELLIDGNNELCGQIGYSEQSVDLSAYADGGSHELEFHSVTGVAITNFFVDLVELPGTPSQCSMAGTSLTLIKQVINNNSGSADPDAWTLHAAGPTPFSGSGPSVSNGPGFTAGSYDLSESGGPAGYTASSWVCTGDGNQVDGDTIVLTSGQSATCTITNDDIASMDELIFMDGFE